MAMRMSTTAPGLQPASRSPDASAPEKPNDAAEASANASPARVEVSSAMRFMTDDSRVEV
jgi:hypothetical protein